MVVKLEKPMVDLRLILEYTQNCASVIGFSLNIVLLYLIFYKTTHQLLEYKIILLQNCLVDLFFTIINDVSKVQTDCKEGALYIFIVGAFSEATFPYNHIMISAFVFAVFLSITTTPVPFIYRYYVIVLERKLTLPKYFLYLVISFLGALSYGSMYFYIFWPPKSLLQKQLNYDKFKDLLVADPFYFRQIPPFFLQDIDHWPLRIIFFHACFLISINYTITVYTCAKVWKKLKFLESMLSKKHKTHRQMTLTLILQALIPLIFLMGPSCAVIFASFFRLNVHGLGVIVSLYWAWIPVVNPLVTISSIKSYRLSIFNMLHSGLELFIPQKVFPSLIFTR